VAHFVASVDWPNLKLELGRISQQFLLVPQLSPFLSRLRRLDGNDDDEYDGGAEAHHELEL
jgi:hypothetical protein